MQMRLSFVRLCIPYRLIKNTSKILQQSKKEVDARLFEEKVAKVKEWVKQVNVIPNSRRVYTFAGIFSPKSHWKLVPQKIHI